MVRRCENIYRLGQHSVLRVEKTRKHKRPYSEKRRQKSIDTKQKYRQVIAKDAGSAPQHSLAVTEDVPGKAGLWRQKIHRCPGKYLADGWRRIRRRITNNREAPVNLARIGVEVVPQAGVQGETARYAQEILREPGHHALPVTAVGVRRGRISPNV